jgi:hypothetical protein
MLSTDVAASAQTAKVSAESLEPLTTAEGQQLHGLLNRLLDEPDC